MPFTTGDNNFGPAKWIVNATAGLGTHTTIATALTSSSSGDTIFIMPGTYTEAITLKAGVDLTAYGCDSQNNVIIKGAVTVSFNGTVSCYGIQFTTNAATCFTVSSANTSSLFFKDCKIAATDGNGFDVNAANFAITLNQCQTSSASTNKVFNVTTVGGIAAYGCSLTSTSTASTIAAGAINIYGGECASMIFTTATTGAINAFNCYFNNSANLTSLTMAGTGSSTLQNCQFAAGTASALSIGTGCTATVSNCSVTSSNTNAITGAGTIVYSNISFIGTSSLMNTTTKTGKYTQLSQYQATEQPAFLAYLPSADLNKTGNAASFTLGSATALTEIYDRANNFNTNGTLTAPITASWLFSSMALFQGCTIATGFNMNLTTSNRTYNLVFNKAAGAQDESMHLTMQADLDAADTATLVLVVGGEAGNTVDIYGSGASAQYTFFSGYQLG